jgi:hypothetical protein
MGSQSTVGLLSPTASRASARRPKLVHVLFSKIAFGQEAVVSVAEHSEVVGRIRTTARPRLSMMKLQKASCVATSTVIADEGTASSMAREYLAANGVTDMFAPVSVRRWLLEHWHLLEH